MKKKYIIPTTDLVLANSQNDILDTMGITGTSKGINMLGGNEGFFDENENGNDGFVSNPGSNLWDE